MKKEKLWLVKHLLLIGGLLFLVCVGFVVRAADIYRALTWGMGGVSRIDLRGASVNFGIYDPEDKFAESGFFALDHYFISWVLFDEDDLRQKLEVSGRRNRWPLVTVEPWNKDERDGSALFEDIVAGGYDDVIGRVCGIFADYGGGMFVRWGHEMENVSGRYPWAKEDGQGFKDSYNYFVERCKEIASNEIYYVWSPVGEAELVDYWPDAEDVDFVGVSVFSFDELEYEYWGRRRTFDEIFGEKYGRVKAYGRPVIVAEMGVNGEAGYQSRWLVDAANDAKNYPLLKSIVYFDSKDSPEAWGEKYSVPDWRVDTKVFSYSSTQ